MGKFYAQFVPAFCMALLSFIRCILDGGHSCSHILAESIFEVIDHIFATLYQFMDSRRGESCNLSFEGIFYQPPIRSWILAESLLCQVFKNAKNSVGIVHTFQYLMSLKCCALFSCPNTQQMPLQCVHKQILAIVWYHFEID